MFDWHELYSRESAGPSKTVPAALLRENRDHPEEKHNVLEIRRGSARRKFPN